MNGLSEPIRRDTLTDGVINRIQRMILEGEVAPSVGFGLLYPVNDSLMVVGEATYEGKRFEGWDADARVLAGVNWKLLPHGVLRLAISGGITDGAPDSQLLAGCSFDFLSKSRQRNGDSPVHSSRPSSIL